MKTNRPFLLPTPYFGIPLGLSALSIAWTHAENIQPIAKLVGDTIGLIAVAIAVIFIAMYAYKLVFFQDEVKAEYHCPVRFAFISLIPITTMLSGIILYRFLPILAEILIWVGTIGQLLYATIRIGALWKDGTFEEKSTRPGIYLPAVATNFTSASGLALLGHHDLAYFFLGAGMFAWVIYEPVLLQHLRLASIEAPFRPTLGIILAPAFVGASAYLTLNGGHVDLFVKALWGYGFLQLFFLVRLLPWIAENGLNMGFWGFSFGLASMAAGSVSFYQDTDLTQFAIVVFIFANVMIAILTINTFIKLLQGKFWAK